MNFEEANALVEDFTIEDMASVLYALRSKLGVTYVWWCKGDIELTLGRDLTDDEWDRVRHSKAWRDWLPDVAGSAGSEYLYTVLDDLGIENGE